MSINLEFPKGEVIPLVELRPDLNDLFKGYSLFVTISPNPNYKMSVLKRIAMPSSNGTTSYKQVTIKMPYCKLPHKVQYEYLMKIINRCYISLAFDPTILGVVEMNKDKNLHAHFIFKDKCVKNDTSLSVFQRDIANCPEVISNLKKIHHNDYMNNIVRLTKTKDEILEYMSKCNNEISEIFPNYCTPNKKV